MSGTIPPMCYIRNKTYPQNAITLADDYQVIGSDYTGADNQKWIVTSEVLAPGTIRYRFENVGHRGCFLAKWIDDVHAVIVSGVTNLDKIRWILTVKEQTNDGPMVHICESNYRYISENEGEGKVRLSDNLQGSIDAWLLQPASPPSRRR